MILPEVPKPDMGPQARFHQSKLDVVTGLYSLQCSVCGQPNAVAYAGLDGEFCIEHTPNEIPYFLIHEVFGRKPHTLRSHSLDNKGKP